MTFRRSCITFFRLLKPFVTIEEVRDARNQSILSNLISADTLLHENIPSAQQGNRRAYIQKNTVERYFPGDDASTHEYFEYCYVLIKVKFESIARRKYFH